MNIGDQYLLLTVLFGLPLLALILWVKHDNKKRRNNKH